MSRTLLDDRSTAARWRDGKFLGACSSRVIAPRVRFRITDAVTSAILLSVSAVVGLFLQSCSAGQTQPALNIGGNWSGRIYPGCRSQGGVNCYERLVTFAFDQQGAGVSGSYTCAFGNVNCMGDNNSGQIVDGKMEGAYLSDLRIVFPDATNCLYQGQFTASDGTGAYMCFAGAGRIVEQGGWHIKRSDQ